MPTFCSRCGFENATTDALCVKCERPIGHIDGRLPVDQDQPSPIVWIITAVVCGLYLVYPSFGVFELIPDVIPIVGNLDEAAATTGLFVALAQLGWNPLSKYARKW